MPADWKTPSPIAVRVLLDFLAAQNRKGGGSDSLDQLCVQHPEQAAELRMLYAEWGSIETIEDSNVAESIVARLARDLGQDIDPQIALRDGETAKTTDSSSEDEKGESGRIPRQLVARGGMATIYRIQDPELRRDLAMKIAHPAVRKTARLLARFLEEAQITAQLDHPGIVPVHQLGMDDDGSVYFTMKLVRGRTLQEVLDLVERGDSEWTRTRALGVLLRVCEAVAFAHSKGVIHRDLKPTNVMVGRFGETYVMDWGLARVIGREDSHDVRLDLTGASQTRIVTVRFPGEGTPVDSPLHTLDGDVVGTPIYMSPEQARGALEEIGPASDVYSAGAILYQLLAGSAPFVKKGESLSARGAWSRVLEGPPEPLSTLAREIPPELVSICEKSMARKITDRYRDMSEMASDLRAFLENRVVKAYARGPMAELRKWVTRNRGVAASIASAVAVVIAAGGYVVHIETRANTRSEALLPGHVRTELNRLAIEAAALWPAVPEKLPSIDRWLRDAQELAPSIEALKRQLEGLETHGEADASGTEGSSDRIALQSELDAVDESHTLIESALGSIDGMASEGERSAEVRLLTEEKRRLEARGRSLLSRIQRTPFRFSEWRDATQYAALVPVLDEAERFHDPDPMIGTVASIAARRVFASNLAKRSLEDRHEEWKEAIEAIADPSHCPAYHGLKIHAQLGLVPLGRDRESGLYEFAALSSGEIPSRDSNGRLVATADSAIVLVLLPGGKFFMGSDPNQDPDADASAEGPRQEIELAPFLIGKYEVTQAQWLRHTGSNPSIYAPGEKADRKISLLCPVENVSWTAANEFASELGLGLPTEAQWEYAARAGTTTPWWTGSSPESLTGAGNIADRDARNAGAPAAWAFEDRLSDGFFLHAPVGSYRPNPFGLLDVIGNVAEWCHDARTDYARSAPRAGDGERTVNLVATRIDRGGSFAHGTKSARSAAREALPPNDAFGFVGLRAVRRLDP